MLRRSIILLMVLCIALFAISQSTDTKTRVKHFSEDLIALKEFFKIPGLSAIILKGDQAIYEDYLGYADVGGRMPMDSATMIPMASLTKIFSGILILQLAEEHKLALDDVVNKYINTPTLPNEIRIKHILSHTSQGKPGEHFYYSNRFSLLTSIIEKASGREFAELLKNNILCPLQMNETFLAKDSVQANTKKIALPYSYRNRIEKGRFQYGYSASSGIISTVRDLARFSIGLDKNLLISGKSKRLMFAPFKNKLPYGLGIFTENLNGKELIWGYGQFDSYSSLLLKLPSDDLTLILAANNSHLSDPARLIFGEAGYSLFVLAFLKEFAFDIPRHSILETGNSAEALRGLVNDNNRLYFFRKLAAQSLAEVFMGQYHQVHFQMSKTLLNKLFELFPDYLEYADLPFLHSLAFRRGLALQRNDSTYDDFDLPLESIGSKLWHADTENPYVNFYLGNYYNSKNDIEAATKYFRQITDAKNFSENWYTEEARNWLLQKR